MEEKRPRVGSAVLVQHNGKFLLEKRNKENYNGYWIIPGEGVGFWETIKEAGIREIKEETNLNIEIIKSIGPKEIINIPGDYHGIVFFHLAKPKSIDIKSKDDLSEAKFFSIEEIKKLKIAESIELILKEEGFWK